MSRRRPATDEVVIEVVAAVRGLGHGVGFSGIVVERGAATSPDVGDRVFGTLPDDDGPTRFVVCPVRRLALTPAGLASAEAAVLAAAGPSALAAIRVSGVRAGDRVMITGAGDDAGAIAVQIAKVQGSHVTAVCRDRDVPLVWDLGADEVLAREPDLGASARFVAVIDTDHSVTPAMAAQLLEPDGRLIGIQHGAVQLSTAGGELDPHGEAVSAEISPGELVELVDRDRVFPVPRFLGELADDLDDDRLTLERTPSRHP